MIIIRHAGDRGHTTTDWLNSLHTFSFADYHDPDYMGFNHLRVINEDIVQPGKGFDTHRHHDMEIITYVVEGAIEHKDSMGTGSIIKPGEIQRMSAGTGISHSEFNHSKTDLLHLLQIWIRPQAAGLQPSYEQKTINNGKQNEFILIGSPESSKDVIAIHQDVHLYAAYLTKDTAIKHQIKDKHEGWLQLIKGKITLNGNTLLPGDDAAIQEENTLDIYCEQNAELLFFDFGV